MTVPASFCNLFLYSLIQSGLPQSGRQKAQGSYFCILVQTREQQEKCPWSIRGCWSFLHLLRATGTHQLLSKPVEHSFTPFLLDTPKFRFPLKSEHILNKFQSLQCTHCLWKQLHQEAEASFTAHGNTPCCCSFTPPWSRWSYPNNTSKRCAPVEEMHKLLLPGGTFQVITCSRARTDIPPPSGCGRCCVCLANSSIPLTGLLLHTSIWLIFTWLAYQKACERLYR